MFKLDKDRYVQILNSKGVHEALTTLHRDTNEWEFRAFEGEKGYQPEMWHDLEDVRKFSRELWEMGLRKDQKSS